MDFEQLRRSIPAAQTMVYLNTGFAGPAPQRVLDRMREAAERESQLGPASPDGLAYAREVREDAAAQVARLLNVAPDDIVLTHGTTEGVNIVLHGLDWQPGDELVTCTLEHPAIDAPTTLLSERRGVRAHKVSLAPDSSPSEAAAAIGAALTPRTRIVALSHITFGGGLRLPAAEIVRAAHDAGALVLLDGAQAAGHIALDLKALDVDFYAISGQKWLFGPGGTGALYVRPDRRRLLTPLFTREGLDFRTGLRMHTLASDSTPLTAGFAEAVRLHLGLGPAAVEERIGELASQLRQGMSSLPGVHLEGPRTAGTTGLTTISVDGWGPPALVEALWKEHRIAVRSVPHPPGVRFATAPFNNESDIDSAVHAIDDLRRRKP